MKYIRTKDGRIIKIFDGNIDNEICGIKFDTMGFRLQITMQFNCIVKEDIVKIADTIEELCDEFVDTSELKTTNTGGGLYDEFDSDNKCLVYYAEDERRTIPLNEFDDLSKIYGAIWCECGLKYVARMNSDGVLELL